MLLASRYDRRCQGAICTPEVCACGVCVCGGGGGGGGGGGCQQGCMTLRLYASVRATLLWLEHMLAAWRLALLVIKYCVLSDSCIMALCKSLSAILLSA